jgi:protein phosphatase PTC1
MIVRLDKDGLVQSQNNKDVGVETESGLKAVSEVDKIVQETKQKIAEGSAPAVGVSASNSGRGHDSLAGEEFVPTTLDGTVEEEPTTISDDDRPKTTQDSENPTTETTTTNTKTTLENEAETAKKANA